MAKTANKKASATASKSSAAATPAKTEQAPAAPAEGTQLTIADLQALASVIDVAVSRGAFRASEATEVGAVFDKLSKFLQVIASQQKAAEEAGKS